MNQGRLFVWENQWKHLGWACKLGGAVSQEITWVGQTVLARLMETQIWQLPVPAVRRLSKGTMASASTSVWDKLPLQGTALKPDNQFLPSMSLGTFKLLLQS